MITWGYLWRFVAGFSAVAALVACTGSDGAAPSPSVVRPTSVSSSTTPTVSPSVSPSVSPTEDDAAAWQRVPKAARAHTFAGAQAFAEFYVGLINKAWTTPDPELLRPYGLPSCKSCANYVRTAEDFRTKSQRYADVPLTVVAGAWLPESSSSLVLVSLVYRQRPVAIVDASGRVVHRSTALVASSEFQVGWQRAGWHIAGIHLESSSK